MNDAIKILTDTCRQLKLGVSGLLLLRDALVEGLGGNSKSEFIELCTILWAKSQQEQETVRQQLNNLPWAEFSDTTPINNLPRAEFSDTVPKNTSLPSTPQLNNPAPSSPPQQLPNLVKSDIGTKSDKPSATLKPFPKQSKQTVDLSSLQYSDLPNFARKEAKNRITDSRFPLTHKTIVTNLRQFRTLTPRTTELDIDATIQQYFRRHILAPVFTKSAKKSRQDLLLLVDWQWSMTPFHPFVAATLQSINQTSVFQRVHTFYFHNNPTYSADESPLTDRTIYQGIIPDMNKIMPKINPHLDDFIDDSVYTDPNLVYSIPLQQVINDYATNSVVIIISDAGAAKNTLSTVRLLNTLVFWRVIKNFAKHILWFNPCPRQKWRYSTAEQIKKYLPMFVLDDQEFNDAIQSLVK
jgi:uncharacterized protein with von Willebrand factor type A (vWA) domain